MSSAPVIAQLGVTASYGGESYSVESFRVRMGINTLATATLVGIKKAAPVRMALAADVTTEMQSRQKARLAGRNLTDVEINATDGTGGKLRFTGFMTAPVMEISRNNIGDQMSVIAEDALIDGLDLGIYTTGPTAMRAETEAGPLAAAYAEAEAGYVLPMLRKITDVLISAYETTKNNAGTDSMRTLLTQQHKANTGKPLEIWHGLLQNGDAKFDSWASSIASSKDLRRVLVERAGYLLQQGASGFWQVLNGVMAAFQLHYVPEPSGRGRIMLSKHKVGAPSGSVDIHATRISATDGSLKIMQPGGVVMITASAARARQEAQVGGSTDPGTIAGQFPNPLLDGYVHREPAPFWLLGADGYPVVPMGEPASMELVDYVNYDLNQYMSRLKDEDRKKDDVNALTSTILNELCEIVFNQIRLADSTANITAPLNFNLKVGERLRMNFGSGASFTGFIDSVAHNIDLTGGTKIDSSTQMVVTHIEY